MRRRLEAACLRAGRRPAEVRLLAVSKGFAPALLAGAAAAGQREFGENYAQEALPKIEALRGGPAPLTWHFIGPIQANKTRAIAAHFNWVQSLARLHVAERLSAQRATNLPPLQVCVQVNISGESSKSGCTVTEAPELCAALVHLPGIQLRGLMTIAAPEPEAARAGFRRMRELYESIAGQLRSTDFDTLSMGMSADFEAAIEEGATLVRVGTAIFGRRDS